MFDYLLNTKQIKLRDEVRDFVKSIPREMIIANEWYKEYWRNKKAGRIRDMEGDAAEADATDEKIFE
ncbi:MAG: hypothetical protein WBY88_17255 [Desulfosarcina sp.]